MLEDEWCDMLGVGWLEAVVCWSDDDISVSKRCKKGSSFCSEAKLPVQSPCVWV